MMPPAAQRFIGEMRRSAVLAKDADRMKDFFARLDLMGDANPAAIEMMEIVLSILDRRNGPVEERFCNLARIITEAMHS